MTKNGFLFFPLRNVLPLSSHSPKRKANRQNLQLKKKTISKASLTCHGRGRRSRRSSCRRRRLLLLLLLLLRMMLLLMMMMHVMLMMMLLLLLLLMLTLLMLV